MTTTDVEDAGSALIDWFYSQDIGPAEAVPILVATLAGAIRTVAKSGGLNAEDGGKIVTEILMESLT